MIPYSLPLTRLQDAPLTGGALTAPDAQIPAEGALKGASGLDATFQGSTVPTLPGLDMTQYALVCFGLVALILVLGWLTKRFLAGNLRARASQRSMKVVDVLPLGGKRQLAVVRCYDRTFVLGMGERDISLVTELDAEEDVEGVLAPAATPAQAKPTVPFGQWIQRALRRPAAAQASSQVDERLAAQLAAMPEPAAPAPQPAAQPAPRTTPSIEGPPAPRSADADEPSYTGLGPGILG